jgi:hypothetical protein
MDLGRVHLTRVGLVAMCRRLPEERVKEFDNVLLIFIRNKGNADKKHDWTGEFRKLDGIILKQSRQSLERLAYRRLLGLGANP